MGEDSFSQCRPPLGDSKELTGHRCPPSFAERWRFNARPSRFGCFGGHFIEAFSLHEDITRFHIASIHEFDQFTVRLARFFRKLPRFIQGAKLRNGAGNPFLAKRHKPSHVSVYGHDVKFGGINVLFLAKRMFRDSVIREARAGPPRGQTFGDSPGDRPSDSENACSDGEFFHLSGVVRFVFVLSNVFCEILRRLSRRRYSPTCNLRVVPIATERSIADSALEDLVLHDGRCAALATAPKFKDRGEGARMVYPNAVQHRLNHHPTLGFRTGTSRLVGDLDNFDSVARAIEDDLTRSKHILSIRAGHVLRIAGPRPRVARRDR